MRDLLRATRGLRGADPQRGDRNLRAYGRIASMMSRVKSLLLEGVRKSCGPPLEPGAPVIHAALRPKLSIGKIGTPYRRPKGTP